MSRIFFRNFNLRSVTRDNVIDWPLDFAIRTGFDPASMADRAVDSINKAGKTAKNGLNYVVRNPIRYTNKLTGCRLGANFGTRLIYTQGKA